jgi:hypothetical protein
MAKQKEVKVHTTGEDSEGGITSSYATGDVVIGLQSQKVLEACYKSVQIGKQIGIK